MARAATTTTRRPPRPRRSLVTKHPHVVAEAGLRGLGLGWPETHEDFPWGHRALKVKGKMFAVMVRDEDGLSLSVKLPASATAALALPFASPTAYGMGKSGWVTARFAPDEEPPVPLLEAWLEESYRAVAPKRLAAQLDRAEPPKRRAR
jgi:predicted DNA-binding protein (MmcQ/YjbR family)